MNFRILVALGLCAALIGAGGAWADGRCCAGTGNLPAGIQAAQLPDWPSQGARLVAAYCSRCHGIPSPALQTAAGWSATVQKMFALMVRTGPMRHMGGMMGRHHGMGMGMRGRMLGRAMPTSAEQQALLAYLQEHAARAQPAPAPVREGAAGLFRNTCARCHALPRPEQHAPDEWPAVVKRMRGYIQAAGGPGLSAEQARDISAYLEKLARGSR